MPHKWGGGGSVDKSRRLSLPEKIKKYLFSMLVSFYILIGVFSPREDFFPCGGLFLYVVSLN